MGIQSPGGKPRFRVGEVEKALRDNGGILTDTAKTLGCTRQTVHAYLNRYPHLKEVRGEMRAHTSDLARGGLFRALKQDKPWAIKLQCKLDGLRERQEMGLKVKVDGSLDVVHQPPSDPETLGKMLDVLHEAGVPLAVLAGTQSVPARSNGSGEPIEEESNAA